MVELYQKGYVKGTVTISIGNEATTIGAAMPLCRGCDVVSLLHRDFGAVSAPGGNALSVALPLHGQCRKFDSRAARAMSITATLAREAFPHDQSFLGKMPSLVVGGTWAVRRTGEDVFGLAVIGDGATSTGEIHESLNLASVHKSPVIFLVENNHYAFSTLTRRNITGDRLSDRAAG